MQKVPRNCESCHSVGGRGLVFLSVGGRSRGGDWWVERVS